MQKIGPRAVREDKRVRSHANLVADVNTLSRINPAKGKNSGMLTEVKTGSPEKLSANDYKRRNLGKSPHFYFIGLQKAQRRDGRFPADDKIVCHDKGKYVNFCPCFNLLSQQPAKRGIERVRNKEKNQGSYHFHHYGSSPGLAHSGS